MTDRFKRWWFESLASVDALSLYERVLLFLSVIAGCIVFTNIVWISPAQLIHQNLVLKLETNSTELKRLRIEVKTFVNPTSTDKIFRNDLAVAQKNLDNVNQVILSILPASAQSPPLAQTLVHLLRRHNGLTLLRTSTLTPEVTDAKVANARNAGLPNGLTRQGVEVTVSGLYPDLTQYVESLEKVLPHVLWGTMTLKSEKNLSELTLQLFLVEMKP